MARTVKDANLQNRTVRAKLKPQKKPYWRSIAPNRHIGYYRGARGGAWIARRYIGDGRYEEQRLAVADDVFDADGVEVLSFGEAQEKARAWFTQQVAPKPGAMTLQQAIDAYVAYLHAEKRSGVDAERRLKQLVPSKLAVRPVAELTRREIEAWRNGMVKRAPADADAERRSKDSANRVLTMLRAALNRAAADEDNAIPSDKAWRAVKPFKDVSRPRSLMLDAAQRQRLINATSGALRDLIIATLYTGSRPAPGEIAQARVRDFHADLGVVTVSGKTGSRDVPLSDEAVRWFQSIAAGKMPDALLLPQDDGTAWRTGNHTPAMREAVRRAKLPRSASMYTLRHTFASEHIMAGTGLKTLSDLMGTSIKMLEDHYGHVLASHKRKVVEAAGIRLGLKGENVTPMRGRKVSNPN
jgi:integrase